MLHLERESIYSSILCYNALLKVYNRTMLREKLSNIYAEKLNIGKQKIKSLIKSQLKGK